MRTSFKNMIDILDYFKDEYTCKKLLEQQRWNGKPICPHCNHDRVYVTNRGYKCTNKTCQKKFSVTIGTVFENSKIKLRYWYAAIYLATSHKKGISSHQLARDLGVTQKTAWFMLQRIREMLKEQSPEMLEGIVEVDGTLIGGHFKNKHQKKMFELREKYGTKTPRGNVGKTSVLGMLQRKGKVVTKLTSELNGLTLQPILKHNITKESKVFTDSFGGYKGIGNHFQEHSKTNHKSGEYVRGEVHTNGIENFWSLLKRGILGIYHHVSPEHLHRYCNEYAYRFNTRKETDNDRFFATLTRAGYARLTYRNLISKSVN